jgi:hypothetical protein
MSKLGMFKTIARTELKDLVPDVSDETLLYLNKAIQLAYELRQDEIGRLEQALISHKMGWQESTERNAELKAQVELLREAILKIGQANTLGSSENLLTCAEKLALATPAQCLAEIRAEAVERATNLYAHRFGNDASLNEVGIDIIRKSKEYIHPNGLRDYVEQLRSGTDGEYSQTTKESQ